MHFSSCLECWLLIVGWFWDAGIPEKQMQLLGAFEFIQEVLSQEPEVNVSGISDVGNNED